MKPKVTKLIFFLAFALASHVNAKTEEMLNCKATDDAAIYQTLIIYKDTELAFGKNLSYSAEVGTKGKVEKIQESLASGFAYTPTGPRLLITKNEEFTAYLFLSTGNRNSAVLSMEAMNKENSVGNIGSQLIFLDCK